MASVNEYLEGDALLDRHLRAVNLDDKGRSSLDEADLQAWRETEVGELRARAVQPGIQVNDGGRLTRPQLVEARQPGKVWPRRAHIWPPFMTRRSQLTSRDSSTNR